MRTGSDGSGRDWRRLSDNDSTNQTMPKEQSPAPSYYYAAPNHFATPNYDIESSPIAAAAGIRIFGTSSYALPSRLPSTVEMHGLGGPSSSSYNTPPASALPSPATHSDEQSPSYRRGWYDNYPCGMTLLSAALWIIAMILRPPHFTPEPWSETTWARPGTDEHLGVRQVIFATVPKRAIWGSFLGVLGWEVLVLQFVYWYGTKVASVVVNTRTVRFKKWKMLFFLLVMGFQAVFMWGWLLWTI